MVLLMVGRTLASVIGHRQDVTNGYPHIVRGMVCGMPQSRCGISVVLALGSIRDAVHRQPSLRHDPGDG
jgi:hypothetical protein